LLILVAVIIGLAIAFLRHGRSRGLAEKIKAPYLVIVSVLCEGMISPLMKWLPSVFPEYLWILIIVQYMLLFLFFMINAHLWTMSVIAIGVLMNFAVIVFNGCRMPISDHIYAVPFMARALERILSGDLPEYFIMHEKVPLWFLGDIFYIPVKGAGFASIGDFFMSLGVILVMQQCMTPAKPRHLKDAEKAADEH